MDAKQTEQGAQAAIVRWHDGSGADVQAVIEAAASVFAQERLVIYPTESSYAIGAPAHSSPAVDAAARLKGRVHNKPIALIAASVRDVERLGVLEGGLARLGESFWPGPLTLTVPVPPGWPAPLSAGFGTIGVRVSPHPTARAVAEAAGGLVTASSANLAGGPPSLSAAELEPRLLEAVDLIVDAGACAGGLPSTVVGRRGNVLAVFRAGAISAGELATVLGYEPALVT